MPRVELIGMAFKIARIPVGRARLTFLAMNRDSNARAAKLVAGEIGPWWRLGQGGSSKCRPDRRRTARANQVT